MSATDYLHVDIAIRHHIRDVQLNIPVRSSALLGIILNHLHWRQ